MKRFAYLRDPLFIASIVAYAVNRLLLKPQINGGFMHNHFNDVICIAMWSPVVAWLAHKLRVRGHDGPPMAREVVLPLVIWSWMFEVWLPTTTFSGTPFIADPMDALSYASGALMATVWWRWWYGVRRSPASARGAAGERHDHGATESPMPLAR